MKIKHTMKSTALRLELMRNVMAREIGRMEHRDGYHAVYEGALKDIDKALKKIQAGDGNGVW